MNSTSTRSRLTLVVAGAAALAALLAGCGSGSGSATASSTTKAPASSTGRAARAGFGGLAGSISSVGTGSFTLKPSTGSDRTVNWTSSTAFTKTASGSLADVTAGSCVAVTEASGSDASTGSVDATAVRISPAQNGTCARGAGGFAGGRFPGSGSRPSGGFGGSRPSGGAGSGGAGFARSMLAGSVASIGPSSFVVNVITPGASGGSDSTTTTAVDVSGSTKYTVTSAASATDLAVGECAAVFSGRPGGSSGSAAPSSAPATGPVTAASVTLSAPVNGSCASGFGRPDGRSGRAPSGSTGANA